MNIRIFVEPQQGATYDDQLQFALATERAGLNGFFRSDHYVAMGDHHPRNVGPTDSWVTLGAIARETTTIRLGTLMSSATFRYPGPLAVSVAQVDQMSNGRVELGLGAGWFLEEHRAYGVPFGASFGQRFDRLEEQLAIVTGMWSTPLGDSFSFEGDHYQLTDCPALPKPRQVHVPIIIGGKGPKRTPAIAAKYADEFNMNFVAPVQAAELRARIDDVCVATGRDPSSLVYSVALTTVIGSDEAECLRRATDIGRDLDEVRVGGLAGTPPAIAERLSSYAEIGVSRVYLQLLNLSDLSQIELIGSELSPLIANL